MNYDDYNEVINGEGTYQEIAKELKDNNAVIIGWTDELLRYLRRAGCRCRRDFCSSFHRDLRFRVRKVQVCKACRSD